LPAWLARIAADAALIRFSALNGWTDLPIHPAYRLRRV
jgi:hypothetical protein